MTVIYDDETTADAMQAWAEGRAAVDLEMVGMVRAGNAIEVARRLGRCAHQSAVGYLPTPAYPGQVGLKPGQSRCTDGCSAVFNNDETWYAAMDAAIEDLL